MATASYLLAPETDVPEHDETGAFSRCGSWSYLVECAWVRYRKSLPDEEVQLADGIYSTPRLSCNFASWKHLEDDGLTAAARAWVRDTHRAWVSSGRSGPPPANGPREFQESTGEPTGVSLSGIIGYRGGFKKLPAKKSPPGAQLAFLCSKAGADEFEWTAHDDTELRSLAEIARSHRGEHLAVWTYGHAIHVWHGRSRAVGESPEVNVASFRLAAPDGRAEGGLSALREALAGGRYDPDWDALEAQLAAPAVSVEAFFLAFGIPGAKELVPKDREPTWEALDRVAKALLRGEAAAATDVRQLNAIIDPIDEGSRLRAKPPKKRDGRTARTISSAAWAVGEGVGDSESATWVERKRAAATYWDITDCPAGERLTLWSQPAGRAAALGRLLGHYPADLIRDPIFLALAAHEAESANGHAFVEGLQELAEHAHESGLTVAIHAAADDAPFREAFGIEGGEAPTGEQAAHAFVDLPDAGPEAISKALADWHAATGASGLVVRADADGAFSITRHAGGAAAEHEGPADAAALSEAARRLAPREVFSALGMPDLLEPGGWTEGAYGGERGDDSGDPQREIARSALRDGSSNAPIDELGTLGPVVEWTGSDDEDMSRRIVAVRIESALRDGDALRELRADLVGEGLVEDYGSAWMEGTTVLAYTRKRLDVGLLTRILADLPPPLRVTFDTGGAPVSYES